MFDNSKPNVIILADLTDVITMSKTLGPYKVANALRRAGFECMVLHHTHTMDFEELKYLLSNLISTQTLFVGINPMFYQDIDGVVKSPTEPMYYKEAQPGAMLPHGHKYNQEFKNFVKMCNPNTKIVLGGSKSVDASWNKDYDYLVFGYADVSIVELARYLQNPQGKLNQSYRSIYGPVVLDDSRAETYDFNNTSMGYVDHDIILPGETLNIEIARGCIFRCTFCSYPLNGKKKLDFIKHEEILYNEFIDNYRRWGTTRYIFSDDTFNDSAEKIEMIWRISRRLPFELEFWAYVRLDLLSAHIDLTDKLFESGLRGCFFGIETMNEKSARSIGKGGNREKQIDTLKYIKDRWGDKVILSAGFILGLPYEDLNSMNLTINMLVSRQIPLDHWTFYPLVIRSDITQHSSNYHSELDKNYTKYGYRKLGVDGIYLDWENDYTNFKEMVQLANRTNKLLIERGICTMGAIQAFSIAGLGFDLDFTRFKTNDEVDWHRIFLTKQQRALEYKNKLYALQGIKPYYNEPRFSWTT